MAAGASGVETVRRSCMAVDMAGESGGESARASTIMDGPRSPAKHGALAAVLALLGAAPACTSLRLPPAPTLSSEIESRNRRLEELFRAGDLLGVADLYADDGVLIDESG